MFEMALAFSVGDQMCYFIAKSPQQIQWSTLCSLSSGALSRLLVAYRLQLNGCSAEGYGEMRFGNLQERKGTSFSE
jgi:hypothetical protein